MTSRHNQTREQDSSAAWLCDPVGLEAWPEKVTSTRVENGVTQTRQCHPQAALGWGGASGQTPARRRPRRPRTWGEGEGDWRTGGGGAEASAVTREDRDTCPEALPAASANDGTRHKRQTLRRLTLYRLLGRPEERSR